MSKRNSNPNGQPNGIVKITLEITRDTHTKLDAWAKRENRSKRKQAALVVAREVEQAARVLSLA